jgi:hypothetical protein
MRGATPGQLGNIGGDAPDLVAGEQIGRRSPSRLVRRASLRTFGVTQKRSNDFASRRISMTGGLASPSLNDYRWRDSGASNR